MTAYATTDLLLANLSPSTPLRPILTRLNADNSWMISLPRPSGPGKAYYHILQDLWLGGALTEWPYTSFLLRIVRRQKGRFDDVADIGRLIADIERAAGSEYTAQEGLGVDAILVSHLNIDHCHRETLERFPRETAVLVVKDAAPLVRGWGHFETVVEVPDLEPGAEGWPGAVGGSAPEWLGVFRVPDRESMYPHIHHGVVFSWGGEALLYSPHGLDKEKMEHAARVAPEGMEWLALIHGLDELGTGQATGRGVMGGLAISEATGMKYWTRTHDGEQLYSGFISWLLRFKGWTFEEGVAEMGRQGMKMEKLPEFYEIENGGALVLV
ncbi:hypothetical protein ACHAQH_005071 [Verticillium albo-atrum]